MGAEPGSGTSCCEVRLEITRRQQAAIYGTAYVTMNRLRQMTTERRSRLETVRPMPLALAITAVVAIGAAVWLCISVALQLQQVPDLAFLRNYHPVDCIEIYDKDDNLVCAINQNDNRKTVPLSAVSENMQAAVLAAEDHHFYEHHGFNLASAARALVANITAHHVVEGGSTITQQLVKNMFFPESGRTVVRKTAEVIVAAQLESRYSKQDILRMYLNEIYFGNGARGIEQAAEVYFGKHASNLSIGESAYLASLIKAPSINGTIERRVQTLKYSGSIIDAMVRNGSISTAQARTAKQTQPQFALAENRSEDPPDLKYPYYVSYVLDQIHHHYDRNTIRRYGLRVYTNLDQNAQEAAENTLSRDLRYAPKGIDQEALVSISVNDGAVRAIVGGAGNYWDNQWNCATNPHTLGSSFKPFVYLTAFIKKKLKPQSVIQDTPLTVNQISMKWSPKNYDGKFLGKMTVREALTKSRNVCAVRVAQMVGIDSVIETARMAGINSRIDHNLTAALGSGAASPLEMASAYGTLARGGVAITPWTVRRIDDVSGHTLETFEANKCRVLPEAPVAQTVALLQDVVNYGTGTLARLHDRPVAGKTGTADQGRDLWFIGFTPDMVTAVWGGNKDNQPIADKHATGGSVIAGVWRDYNRAYYAAVPQPAGTLICAKHQDQPEQKQGRAIAYRSMSHSHDTVPGDAPAAASVLSGGSNPANGYVTRQTHGITEYAWAR